MATQDAAVLLAQRLAGNDKKTRDRALRKLRNYLRVRSACETGGFTEEEFIKIWKGLFYCMWMQDKPLLQEALAHSMSQLVHTLHTKQSQNIFLRTFWQTLNREWNGIDRLRLDKFYTLMRLVLRESVDLLKKAEWEESCVQEFLVLLDEEILRGSTLGVQLHVIDIYLEEVAKVGSAELTAEMNLKLIEPFCKIVAKCKNSSFLQAVTSGIFQTILEQAPFAIEDLMKEVGSNPEGKGSTKDGGSAGEESEEEQSEEKESPEEDNEDIGPVLQFDYQAVADRLFALGSRKNTPTRNRKAAYALVKKFRDLAEGIFPSDDFPEEVSTDEDDDDFSSWLFRRRMKRAQENGTYGMVSQVSSRNAVKKEKQEKRKRTDVALDDSSIKNGPPAAKKKRKRKKTDRNNNTESGGEALKPSQNGVTKSCSPENQTEQPVSPDPAQAPSSDSTPSLQKKSPGKKRRAGLIRRSLCILPLTGSLLRRRQLRLHRNKCKQAVRSSTPETEETPVTPQKEVTQTPQNFMSFQKANSPKPVYVKPTKARGRQIPTKMGSKSKKVTFSLNKNMTTEFKRTDRSLLVSPTGSSRVPFNPEQRPEHGVLKTPTRSPVPRARAADFF
ncbi:uncharacterized protein LOC379182 isoform X2 [Xenopus laevis]|uniref:Uncharacterized protein LOC379182 isoform X2 n=1 Tax=Xenopus laevis TaxID=8355 RepID=A0A8J0UHW0_XENLA|nr:uncharacterized protein LOC379182 isoform X2 [Xenopus laevis]